MTPAARYRADLEQAGFRPDPAQRRAVRHLQSLHEALRAPPRRRWWQTLTGRRPAPVRGLYLWGGPGRGKTWLMDRFHDSLPFAARRRVHFHRFMLEVHARLDALPRTPDPLRIVARGIAGEARVLCLDEFHVTDIADAMLLAGLLEALFQQGITLVATSNLRPRDLYPDGLQRERFLPAIGLIERHTRVLALDGGQDFRLLELEQGGTSRIGGDGGAWLAARFDALVPPGCRRPATVLRVSGREVPARALAEDVAWFDFDTLCRRPLSARDYLELAREFHTLLLQDVPQLDEEADEAARRFMHLVDALYDHGVKLVMNAAVEPARLYRGRRLAAAFARTASRLTEMAGAAYLARPHRPD